MSENKVRWSKWKAILNRIVSHKDYRYDAPWSKKGPLLKLADFAQKEMRDANNKFWRDQKGK